MDRRDVRELEYPYRASVGTTYEKCVPFPQNTHENYVKILSSINTEVRIFVHGILPFVSYYYASEAERERELYFYILFILFFLYILTVISYKKAQKFLLRPRIKSTLFFLRKVLKIFFYFKSMRFLCKNYCKLNFFVIIKALSAETCVFVKWGSFKYSHEIKTRKASRVYANLHSYSLRIINIKWLRKETKLNCNVTPFSRRWLTTVDFYFVFVSHSLLCAPTI